MHSPTSAGETDARRITLNASWRSIGEFPLVPAVTSGMGPEAVVQSRLFRLDSTTANDPFQPVTEPASRNWICLKLNAIDLEKKYLERVNRSGSLLLLPAADAVLLLDDLVDADARFLGVEAFRFLDDGGVQPAMEFSNISFGQLEQKEGEVRVKSFRRDLRDGWRNHPDALSQTKDLIQEGRAKGYDWFEVSVEDPETGELLFFRVFEK